MKTKKIGLISAAALSAVLLGLTGCSDAGTNAEADTSGTPEAPLEFSEAWAKATDTQMSGVFGDLTNTSEEPVTVTGGEADFAGIVEMHETVDDGTGSGLMQEREGGFTIEPGDTLELRPGDDHIMFMELDRELVPGEEVTFSITFDDGASQEFTTLIKEYAGANETYVGDDHGHDH